MMTASTFLNLFSRRIWLIDQGYPMSELLAAIKARISGETSGERKPAAPALKVSGKKMGVLKLSGPLVKGVDPEIAQFFGMASYDMVHAAADTVRSEGIDHLVLHLDSPGGMVTGCMEAADRLLQLRQEGVKITAYSDTLMCSAAYWLGAAADEIVASPTAMVGSIGCMALYTDQSELFAKAGIKPEYFVNKGSEAKLYGRPGYPWTDEARASFQESVDSIGTEFKTFLSEHRPGLKKKDMNGDSWDAFSAPAGYVDYLAFPDATGEMRPVSTIGDLVSILAGTSARLTGGAKA
jgi:ClpP class serine protease